MTQNMTDINEQKTNNLTKGEDIVIHLERLGGAICHIKEPKTWIDWKSRWGNLLIVSSLDPASEELTHLETIQRGLGHSSKWYMVSEGCLGCIP